MAVLQQAAFEKQSWGESADEVTRQNYQTYCRYYHECPTKLTHCRIIKSPDGSTVLAACQLLVRKRRQEHQQQIVDEEPNNKKESEVIVEWIACHPDHMNKGMGSTLLAWAMTFAKQELRADTLTLFVVKANTGAMRLYKRRGFVVRQSPIRRGMCGKMVDGIVGLACLGMDRYWTVLTMDKDLLKNVPI